MRLRRWRQERGLDGRELAKVLGISPSWVSKIERGLGRPKPSLVRRISKALGKPYLEVWRAVNEDYEREGHEEARPDGES
jgi:transcriptional regulator with XRE-family HTH domain